MSYNLPPGCTESDIPGNRPEDTEFDRFIEWLSGFSESNEINISDFKTIFKMGYSAFKHVEESLEELERYQDDVNTGFLIRNPEYKE